MSNNPRTLALIKKAGRRRLFHRYHYNKARRISVNN